MKCLALAGRYTIVGCDVSADAFGHFAGLAEDTRTMPRDGYLDAVLDYAVERGASAVIGGGGEPMRLISEAQARFEAAGVRVIGASAETVALAEDKRAVAEALARAGVEQPAWVSPQSPDDPALAAFTGAVVVKPATNSGASRYVFLAEDGRAASPYVRYLLDNSQIPLVQAYLPVSEGEFSVGALSRRDGAWVGAIVMKRIFINQLSIASSSQVGLISSAYGQGRFGAFPEIEGVARRIAAAVGSSGPLNIQGRVREGRFVAFEVNARFSGSCYLRALAGFNEPDLVLREQLFGETPPTPLVTSGLAVRGLSEVFVAEGPSS
jgi:carbamoyl-phosphate synthase large subunit